MTKKQQLDALLKLYKPRVGKGNFQADVFWRGQNEMLATVIVTLGLATEVEVTARFRALDDEDWRQWEKRLAEINARKRRLAREAG